MTPLLTLVIPTLNSENYIERVLKSIQVQSCQNFELVIMDALSTDQTLSILGKFADKIKIRIISESDKGIYDAMNKGIQYAKGDWVYFMGADDRFIDEWVLEKIVPFLNKENDVVYGDSIWIPENTNEEGEWTYEKLIHQSINHQRIFYRKSLFGKFGGYNLRYKIAADHDLNIRFFCNSEISKKHVKIPIAFFHTGGFSANKIDVPFWEDWDKTVRKPFTGLLSKKTVFGSLGKYIRYLSLNRKYTKAFLLVCEHFYNTKSLGFLKLMLIPSKNNDI